MSVNRKRTLKARDYLECEDGTILKNHRNKISIAAIYPNTYYLGMSNLGFQSIYSFFNQDPDVVCERAFLPDDVVVKNNFSKKELRSIESKRAIHEFDCVAFSISFENDYLNLLSILDLSHIPFYNHDRKEDDPIIIAGGAAITINPEPIRPFCDLLFVGEAEEAVPEINDILKTNLSRENKILKLGQIEGMYISSQMDFSDIPYEDSSICPESHKPNSLETRVPLAHLRKYKRRVPKDINSHPIESVIHTPYSEFGKLSLIEVQRGCGRGCKFCAEGFIYTPFRERDFDLVKKQVLRGLKYRNKIGLIGADLLVYPHILDLMRFIHEQGGTFSPSSVRLDSLTPEIVEQLVISGHKTLAIAPEAGSSDLRKNINKKFDNDNVIRSIDQLLAGGIPNIKMYIMIGLPNEKPQDIEELIHLVKEAKEAVKSNAKKTKKAGKLILSINPFIPKPRTPYQIGVFEGIKSIEAKVNHIKKKLLPLGGIKIYYENPFFAYIQALLSNGRSDMSDYLLEVFKNKGSLKKSLRPFLI